MLDDPDSIAYGVVATLAYAGVSLLVLSVGYLVLDLITPGHLRRMVFHDRNRNASIISGAHLVALSFIVITAVVTSDNELDRGLLQTAVYGGLGVLLLALGFKITDWLTPGHLGHIVTDDRPHPAAYVTGIATLALGAVLAAAVS